MGANFDNTDLHRFEGGMPRSRRVTATKAMHFQNNTNHIHNATILPDSSASSMNTTSQASSAGTAKKPGRPSKFSEETLEFLNKWAKQNVKADSEMVKAMHAKYLHKESLESVRKWFLNYKHRLTPGYRAMKGTYAERSTRTRKEKRFNNRVQYTTALLAACNAHNEASYDNDANTMEQDPSSFLDVTTSASIDLNDIIEPVQETVYDKTCLYDIEQLLSGDFFTA